MALEKIHEYALQLDETTILGTEFMDLDHTSDGGGTYTSAKVLVDDFVTYVNENGLNIYVSDGSITANRTLTADTFWTKWIDGDVIVEMVDELTDYAFLVYNSSSAEMGRLGFDQATASGIIQVSAVGGLGPFFEVVSDTLTMNTNGFVVTSASQIGVGTAAPDASALMEFVSTTEGILFPRMTGTQAALIPAIDGLVVYVTDVADVFTPGFWGYQVGAWAKL